MRTCISIAPADCITSTHLEKEGVPPHTQRHFRQAFAIIGALIAEGEISVDFSDERWATNFEAQITIVTKALDTVEYLD